MWKKALKRSSVLLVVAVITSSYSDADEEILAEYVLAIQLMPNWSGPVTFGVATRVDGNIMALRHISMREFIMIGTGQMSSQVNPTNENLFAKHGIEQCVATYDSTEHRHFEDCKVVETLWKLRYKKLPSEGEGEGSGYARHTSAPDEAQLGQLKTFGIRRLNDFIYDDQVFRLLKASQDPQWIASYR
ncbi:MAG: hypothetical protein RL226_111 [Bacteroidota bacterium]